MEERKNKVTIKGWISLIILVMILSGAFKDVAGPLAAFDFNNLMGKLGTIVDGIDFTGKNGSGVRDGFIAGLVLLNAVLFIPAFHGLFMVADLTIGNIGTIYLLAFMPTVIIQLYKVVKEKRK